MGLFSSKKKTYVYTSVSRMVEDEDIIPSNKLAVMDYVTGPDANATSLASETISDYLIRATENNIVARARKMRNYANRSDYAYGVLTSNLVSRAEVDIKDAVQDVLESIYPDGVRVVDAYFGPMNNFYFLRPILWHKYGYNMTTNELVDESARIGFKCYMESAVIKYSKYTNTALIDPDTLKQVGPSAESGYTPFRAANPKAEQVPWVNNNDMDYDIAEVTVVYKDAAGKKQSYKLIIDYLDYEASSKPIETGLDDSDTDNIQPDAVTPYVPPSLEGQDYFQANYEFTQNGVTKKDVFIYLFGSGLQPELDNLFNVTDMFGSYVPRIYARLDGMKCNDDSLKNTPRYKSMVNICNKFDLKWTSWVDEIHKSVGSVRDVSQIFMQFALPANTKDKLIQEYMYEYFMGLYGRIPNKFATSIFKDLDDTITSYGSKQGQTIRIVDKAYTQQISFSSIGYMDIEGTIGVVGSVQSGQGVSNVTVGRKVKGLSYRPSATSSYHYYRKQLTATTYREVRVYSLSSTEVVQGGYSTTASGNSENLLIPLDLAVDHEFNPRQLEELYTKAMYIVLNTIKVVKTKWYQTGIFKAIMFIVAVVVSYFFPPTGAAVWTWTAAAYAAAQAIVISLVTSLVVKLLVSLGVNVGVAAAIVAVAALVYGGYLAVTKSTGVLGMTTPKLLSIASQAFNASNQGYALQTRNAVKEFNSLMTSLTKEQEELQKKARELSSAPHGDLLLFEQPYNIGVWIGESPDDYYNRSIHVTNMASTIYSLIDMSVSLGLTLPTTQSILSNLQESQEWPITIQL